MGDEQMTKYVYKEISGRDLEEMTGSGWEYVERGMSVAPFGVGSYIVRRPFEMPEAMKLAEELVKTKDELERAKERADTLYTCLTSKQEMLADCQNKVTELRLKVIDLENTAKKTAKTAKKA